jgi:hypothetical protein
MTRMTMARRRGSHEKEVRMVSSELVEAHSEAVRSFGQVFDEQESISKMKNERIQRMTRFGSTRVVSSSSPLGPATPTPPHLAAMASARAAPGGAMTTVKSIDHDGGGDDEEDEERAEELLAALLRDMRDERSQMKRAAERDNFDSIWGSVHPPSPSPPDHSTPL